MRAPTGHLLPGDLVVVRSWPEIRATLDENGAMEGLPFMEEMQAFCGRALPVSRRVEQVCVEGAGGIRRMAGSVLLDDLRCDGSAHDGCDKSCALFWKEAWLKPANPERGNDPPTETVPCKSPPLRSRGPDGRYFCQSTELLAATRPLAKWNPRRWYLGLLHRGLRPTEFVRMLFLPFVLKLAPWLFGYQRTRLAGDRTRTPAIDLDLQPGELVEVRKRHEITGTLDHNGRNRGLAFTPLMLPFCEKRFVVKRKVRHMIDETTGQFKELKHTVLLEGVTCDGHTVCGGCPRDAFHLWREAWLKRVENNDRQDQANEAREPLSPSQRPISNNAEVRH